MAPPFSSSNYKTSIINSSHIIDRGIKGIDIELGTIELNNLSAAAIASLSGGGGGGPPGPDSVGTSQIINASVTKDDLSTQLQDFIDNTKTALAVSKINLIINNKFDSHKPVNYAIIFTDENSNVTAGFSAAEGIFPASSHSVLLSIESNLLTTNITLILNTNNNILDYHAVESGATETDYSVNGGIAYLTFVSDGSPNIEIVLKVLNN
jgi:hypothetical protein